ncbi:DUF4148 domain-containing protein [Burkholderia sp. WSM2230]|uniref:DUF4148 domain-containing protein n=1 Tax=Burkholderia sp. WSM2230 TaxID=944435 RepID=UPI0003F88A4F|nr:DUF4148 domain-containing protein [Burkholderia sp. WSM2230]
MKRLLLTSILAIAAVLPAVGFAQTASSPLTRADVRVQSAQAARDHRMNPKLDYPDSQQAARHDQSADTGGYGTQNSGSSESRMVPLHGVSSASGAKTDLFAHH